MMPGHRDTQGEKVTVPRYLSLMDSIKVVKNAQELSMLAGCKRKCEEESQSEVLVCAGLWWGEGIQKAQS